jgi:hypothetical protein
MTAHLQPVPADIEARLGRSADVFRSVVWPFVHPILGAGRMSSVEGVANDDFRRQMDFCGIDYLFAPSDGDVFGIAQRTQIGSTAWDTFTMSPSGFNRLDEAFRSPAGRILPAVTVHAYVRATSRDSHELVSVGMIKTFDLIDYGRSHQDAIKKGASGSFFAWSFDDLEAAGIKVDRAPRHRLRHPFDTAQVS